MRTAVIPLALALAGLTTCAFRIRAQSQSPVRLEFDVASVKRVPPSDSSLRVSMTGEHGRINYTNITVRGLIRKAYGLQVYPLSAGGSDPLSTDRYDIVAKASGDASDEQTMRMLQALLDDRFRLKVHRETKELPVYALVTGKGGPKFHEVTDDGTAADVGGRSGYRIIAHHVSMSLLVNTLKGYVGGPVLDMTGLTGIYDLSLDFTSDESLAANSTSAPSIFTAVQEQLGLKLEARKGPVEVVVIDHVEKPSEN